jgi:5-methylcytosine-specific restriction endonuclease McrA
VTAAVQAKISEVEQSFVVAGRAAVHAFLDDCESHGGEVNRLRALPYNEYLQSEHWQRKRAEALERADRACQLCASTKRLQVHHRSYENLGAEDDADLTVLCADCHAGFHGK